MKSHYPSHPEGSGPTEPGVRNGNRHAHPTHATPGSVLPTEVDACDECGLGFPITELWPVRDLGLLCAGCVDEMRLRGLA